MNQERMRSSLRLEDIPELMHQIQFRLPAKQAARTSVLSKSWLKAWYTIPTLRFHVPKEKKETKHMKLVDVERTLIRYLRDNIPIQKFELSVDDIENQELASLAEKLIRIVATKTCVKELSLTIRRLSGASLHLPEEILSGQNLTKIRVSVSSLCGTHPKHSVWMATGHHPKCVSLRELHLHGVRISKEVLHDIFVSCKLLVKMELLRCSEDLNTIKITNLPCLYELTIHTNDRGSTAFEINNVPNLCLLRCGVHTCGFGQPWIKSHSISLGSSITELNLGGGLITDQASLDMIMKPGLPFLESLTIHLRCWTLTTFHLASASVKRFSLLQCPSLVDGVHVYAPKLLFFCFDCSGMPSLFFPVCTLEQTRFYLHPNMRSLDASFFLKMREALTLSSRCEIHITANLFHNPNPSLGIDIDDLRARLPLPPARNVQKFWFNTSHDECLWERSWFFDVFFEIFRPERVSAMPDRRFKHKNHFCKLMLTEVVEKNKKTTSTAYWPRYLKHVKIRQSRQSRHKQWETLTDSHTTFLDKPPPVSVRFKLNWC